MSSETIRALRIVSALRALLVLAAVSAAAAYADTQGKIYPDPVKPFPGFKPHELSFETPKDGVARDAYKSEPFYAIILKTADRCSVTEKDRLAVQAQFPNNKVFSTRFQCDDDVEENISYTNVNEKFGFIAVYAGATAEQAQAFLAKVNATGKFPGANVRKMQAVLVYP